MPDVTVRESRTYSPLSPHSYFADQAAAINPLSPRHHDAKRRLEKHAEEFRGELRSNECSRESRYVQRCVTNMVRNADPRVAEAEYRAMTTGSGSGLALVTPQYLVQDYHLYRENPAAFLEQLPVQDIGDYGMTMNVPALTSPAAVTQQGSEGQGNSETDPSGQYRSSNTLGTFSGQITISQQLLDRSGPGPSFDQFAYNQMREEYEQQVDTYVITQALANATVITDSTVWASSTGIANLYGDIFNARYKLETAAGTKLRPTHLFFLPVSWGFIASQLDSQSRPILTPAPFTADTPMRPNPANLILDPNEDKPPAGYSGYNIGDVPVFTDNSIPLTGGFATIVLLNGNSVVPFVQQDPTMVCYPETFATSLQAVVRLHGYATAVVVHPNGVVGISGAAYSATPTFAG